MRPKAKISQQRIARDLGVSQALVSLVLNGRKNGINPDSYRKIWDHAVRLGYSPKGMRAEATPDRMGTCQVGLIKRSGLHLANPSNFFTQVQHGLHAALLAAGVSTVLLGPEENLDERLLGRLLQTQSNATGIVILGEVKLPFLQAVRRLTRRVVAVSASYPCFCQSVLANEPQSPELLLDPLANLGHTRL